MEKHTPGPWQAAPTGDTMRGYKQPYGVASFAAGQKPCLVAGCFGDNPGGHDEARANAHLIAASPDLLAALKVIMAEASLYGDHFANKIHELAIRAIAKAEGR